ncbi:NAD(P)/FAD-dependent oxidoreductase [Rhodococcus jostii]|uniref:NAD(P)/FAD-dependent oxidoreductase n=1 Tax=Rhodococcus jostii TaxID=132919 RepID=UPI00362B0A48
MSIERAVVIGGSVAGLLAAIALAESCKKVVIVERDELPDAPIGHNGAPQGKQIHVCLPAGLAMIEQLIPDFGSKLEAEGCPEWDELEAVPYLTSEGWRVRTESPVKTIGFRRPLFEWVIRRHLLSLPNTEVRVGTVKGLASNDDATVVTGVELASGETEHADLVVDASGRASQAPKWFEKLGYAPPVDREVRVNMGYASQVVSVPEGLLPEGVMGLNVIPYPGHHRGAVLLAADNGTFMLTAVGMVGDYPPGDRDALLEYIDGAPSPLIGEIARQCEPIGEINTYRMPGNRKRVWEDLESRPGGFVAVGDALGSFNPIYGQGMTSAANAALTLRSALAELDGRAPQFPAEFHERLRDWTNLAFEMAAGADCLYEGAELIGWERPSDEELQYATALEGLATEDPEVLVALGRAQYMMEMDALDSDSITAKAEAWISSRRTPHAPDITTMPGVTVAAATV